MPDFIQTTSGAISNQNNVLLQPGFPIVGGDASGANLVIRSTNNNNKGTVLLDETTQSTSSNTGALQVLGGVGVQGNVSTGSAFNNLPFGYGVTNIMVPTYTGSYNSANGAITTPAIFISPPNLTGGVQAVATAVMTSNSVSYVNIINPGSGYTIIPTVTFQDPTPQAAVFWTASLPVVVGNYIKAAQTSGSPGSIYYYLVTVSGALGASIPTHTSSTAANGGATLSFVGIVAQGYTGIGYVGMNTAGAVQQTGMLTQLIITAVGSAYTAAPTVVIGRPDLPGGRQAAAVISSITANSAAGTVIPANVLITDAGSGYLYPPTVTFIPNGGGSAATAVAVIGNPGERPIVSTVPVQTTNSFFLDFSLDGQNVLFFTVAVGTTIFFDNIGGTTPWLKGFPLGRRVTIYIKATATSLITFSNLTAVNANWGANTQSVTIGTTRKFEFIVLTQTAVGGQSSDVYAFLT